MIAYEDSETPWDFERVLEPDMFGGKGWYTRKQKQVFWPHLRYV